MRKDVRNKHDHSECFVSSGIKQQMGETTEPVFSVAQLTFSEHALTEPNNAVFRMQSSSSSSPQSGSRNRDLGSQGGQGQTSSSLSWRSDSGQMGQGSMSTLLVVISKYEAWAAHKDLHPQCSRTHWEILTKISLRKSSYASLIVDGMTDESADAAAISEGALEGGMDGAVEKRINRCITRSRR